MPYKNFISIKPDKLCQKVHKTGTIFSYSILDSDRMQICNNSMVSVRPVGGNNSEYKIFACLFRITGTTVIVYLSVTTRLEKLVVWATASIP